MKTCYQTDPGKVRSHNEDSVTIIKNMSDKPTNNSYYYISLVKDLLNYQV